MDSGRSPLRRLGLENPRRPYRRPFSLSVFRVTPQRVSTATRMAHDDGCIYGPRRDTPDGFRGAV
jgi:hypothetical protein